jgi:leucyl aminopeptidase
MKKNKHETHFPRTSFLLAVLLAGVFASGCAAAQDAHKTWITVGDAAYQKLKQVAPQVLAKQSQVVETSDVHSKVKSSETVHLLQVNEDDMLKLSGAIHGELKRCGGFVFHASEAEGRKTLQAKQAPATTLATLSRPAYVIDNQTTVTPILNTMQDSNIAQTIGDLSTFVNRYYTTTGGSDASNWLKTKWTSIAAGRADISVTQFAHTGYNQKSVIATINGTDNASEVVVLGGHLDSINQSNTGETGRAPGADDDASGIASLTEAFRAMVAAGYKPRRTIKFIGYAAEEVGLRGSAAIAQNFKTNNVNVVGVMQLDMTNYKGSPSDIYIYTDYTDSLQNDFVVKIINTYLPTLTIGYDKCGYGCSDHASWNAQGYPASMPFETSFTQDNPYIHTANDTSANSGNQAIHALKFARMAAAYAVELGSDGPGPLDRVETFSGTLTKGQKKNFGPFKAGIGSFRADTTGTGDTDLYVRKSAAPTTTTYTCKSEGQTSTETCTVNLTANGDMYVMLNGYSASSYTLKVTYRPQ